MSRTERLLQLMQVLRWSAPPVTAAHLAREMRKSQRTIYRDVETLRALGAVIDGEAGFGYRLIEDAALPPLGFDDDEIEALVLGLRDVEVIGDPALAKAARSALAKIKSRLPPGQAHRLQHAVLNTHRFEPLPEVEIDVAALRAATWDEVVVSYRYTDAHGAQTQRQVCPLGLVFLDNGSVLLAWCLLRQDYRVFRLDRMRDLVRTEDSFRPRRVPMLREHIARIRSDIERSSPPGDS